MPRYEYEALGTEWNIRLLEVLPGKEEEPIQCSLTRAVLNTNSKYVALSYAWGDAKDCRLISINNHELSVTTNLYSAIRRIRSIGDRRRLWTDAICINQEDRQEKEFQVSMMGQIYKQAQVVIADIGEETNDSELGFNHGMSIRRALAKLDNSARFTSVDDYESHGLPPLGDIGWTAWSRLLTRPWFSRLWIIQEYALPSNVVMLFGKRHFASDVIPTTVNMMHKYGVAEYDRPIVDLPLRQQAVLGSQKISTLSVVRQAVLDRDHLDLLDLLKLVRGCNVTDPKDIVYGLLGLASDFDVLQIKIDYSENFSAQMLYQEVTKKIMQNYNRIDLLYEAERAVALPGVPSWVPYWNNRLDAVPIGLLPSTRPVGSRGYSASGSSKASVEFQNQDRLAVRGTRFDGIAVIGSLINVPSPGESTSDAAMWCAYSEWEHEARDIMNRLKSYPTGCSVFDAYWRTLIVNKTIEGLKPEPEFGEAYKAMFRRPLATKDEVEFASHPPGLFRLLRFYYDKLVKPSFGKGYAHPHGRSFFARMSPMVGFRRFGITSLGYVGLFPAQAQKGDVIVIIYGAPRPFVLRPKHEDYQLIGECYVHGIMDGEAMKGVDPEMQWEEITLV